MVLLLVCISPRLPLQRQRGLAVLAGHRAADPEVGLRHCRCARRRRPGIIQPGASRRVPGTAAKVQQFAGWAFVRSACKSRRGCQKVWQTLGCRARAITLYEQVSAGSSPTRRCRRGTVVASSAPASSLRSQFARWRPDPGARATPPSAEGVRARRRRREASRRQSDAGDHRNLEAPPTRRFNPETPPRCPRIRRVSRDLKKLNERPRTTTACARREHALLQEDFSGWRKPCR